MAEVEITVQSATFNGVEATYTTDSTLNGTDTFQFKNDGKTIMHFKNGDSSQHTVTVETPRKVSGLDVAEVSVDLGASVEKFIGPFPPGTFNAGGLVSFTLDAGTSMEVAILRL